MKDRYSPKKYCVQTFGCQANIADSNTMCGILDALGLERVEEVEDCDLFIVNTCSVRQKSEDKVYGLGKKMNSLNEKNIKKT